MPPRIRIFHANGQPCNKGVSKTFFITLTHSIHRMEELLRSLILLSEKAGCIARTIRQDSHLLSLLVQEKSGSEKNPCLFQDFKTLADVLVQEVVRHEIGQKFPELDTSVFGEENNSFTNIYGESIIVNMGKDEVETADLLIKVLAGDDCAAKLLAAQVHSVVQPEDVNVEEWPNLQIDVPFSELAIWIDPIDSTAEYICGGWNEEDETQSSGLACVTILIGIFHKVTGVPIAGVINQPFYECLEENRWVGRVIWGISFDGSAICSFKLSGQKNEIPKIALSANETEEVKSKLSSAGFALIKPAGAGYKFLCIITGIIDAYLLSKGSTYFWDTCSCHAVLKSQGGTVIKYKDLVQADRSAELIYSVKTEGSGIQSYCNNDGIIAFRNKDIVGKIASALK